MQQVGVLQNEPIGVADTINLKYTDSFQLIANLLSPKMLDYSNLDFAFSELPAFAASFAAAQYTALLLNASDPHLLALDAYIPAILR